MLRKIAEFRLGNFFVIRKVFVFANCIMLFINLLWLIGGIRYTKISNPDSDEAALASFMYNIKIFLGFFFVIVLAVCLSGCFIGLQEQVDRCVLCSYGTCLFFLVMIPLLS